MINQSDVHGHAFLLKETKEKVEPIYCTKKFFNLSLLKILFVQSLDFKAKIS